MVLADELFHRELIKLADTEEWIVRGNRTLFPLLPRAFKGVSQIGVIGWASQATAQAQNLRDSLQGSGIKVVVGLREGSTSAQGAEKAGFSQAAGTLGEMYEVIGHSDLVLLLISDAAQVECFDAIMHALKPGATLGLSHGFLLGYLNSVGKKFRPDINVIAVCPKGMGRSVRRLYEQGKTRDGAGINCSYAVHQDVSNTSADIALGWAIAIGAPYIFETTLQSEYRSDIFGERGVLLGGVHGMCEALYRWFRASGTPQSDAFLNSAKCITGPISKKISDEGLIGVYDSLPSSQKAEFKRAYSAAYRPLRAVLEEIYEEVASNNEIRSVISASARLSRFPFSEIAQTDMWRVGREIGRGAAVTIHPVTAGIYVAAIMAQADLLLDKGHCYSEVINESIIEAIDSLNPYMDHRDVAFMVDNCSTTARLGARKWAPLFDYAMTQSVLPVAKGERAGGDFSAFLDSPLHAAIAKCLELRPSISIAVID